MSRVRLLVFGALIALIVGVLAFSSVAVAKPAGGKSDSAQACDGTGYLSLYRQDGSRFTNAGE